MTDLDRYLADDMIHAALRASDSANEGGVVGGRERMMRAAIEAVLPDIIRQAKAEALRDAADEVYGDERAKGPYPEPLSIASWLRVRADRIEHDARCPHPKCPGGGLCCCLSEQGGQP